MKLSDGEKLILMLLCDIAKKGKELDPDLIQSAIVGNHLWGLAWKYSFIPFEPAKTPPEVTFVVDVLDMWTFIESGFKRLSPDEQSKVTQINGRAPAYEGFDGNNEGEYYAIVRFLVDDLKTFANFKDRAYIDSHSPKVLRYQLMLMKFLPIRSTLADGPLTADQILLILKGDSIAE